MGTVTPEELLKRWTLEKLPVEMAIGHILQNLLKVQAATEANGVMLRQLRTDVDGLIAHTGMMPRSQGKNKPRTRGRR